MSFKPRYKGEVKWEPKYRREPKLGCICAPCIEAAEYHKNYYACNAPQISKNSKRWRRENREQFNAYHRNRTALKHGVTG